MEVAPINVTDLISFSLTSSGCFSRDRLHAGTTSAYGCASTSDYNERYAGRFLLTEFLSWWGLMRLQRVLIADNEIMKIIDA